MSLHVKLIALLLLATASPLAADPATLTLDVQDEEFELRHYPAEGEVLALWLAPDNGFGERHDQVARALQQQGIESWQVDLLENLFLPRGSASIREIDPALVGSLIERAQRRSGKPVVLLSNSYGAIPALRGMRAWQQDHPGDPALIGAILFSPDTHQGIPSLGLPPQYVPETYASNMPLMILQSARNGNRGQLDDLIAALRTGGSQVFVQMMPGATSLFYEEDKAQATLAHLQQAPARIVRAIHLLDKLPKPEKVAALPEETPVRGDEQLGLDIGLKPFRGDWSPPVLDLEDANGRQHLIDDYTGKVRVINFWATWCPPCVEEIPSLNRLREQFDSENFELISVNYAQRADEVKEFLQEVEVNFPVLIDQDGTEADRWQVIAFPSTYVIDAEGRIRYGVNAAIEWDDPQVIDALRQLIRETP
ncbi:TlpA disulfide reductase family protein [Thiohalophilus thiocyanatoxydans]|uniref:Thiol-disulfide isomerase/thioredoxin n=1 Tax=Thiohalophilus thiocyanatoxydans TaxID=381308 RepID=A0A4V6QBV7_9GAMM|nr:TlpA disulfide reductase family protein [Thiohalophilus thiocyanatoxydans]TDY00495.1 thiol-disulfide isomerase/thioredoxin [Thiohalophilus thiocyanatoxydans]